jgi:predicted ATP-dependent endonuclease of OLD family
LKDVRIDLEGDVTIFVGSNNSGKTSATHVFHSFFNPSEFSLYDFSADCWAVFDEIGASGTVKPLPTITLDLWFKVEAEDIPRVIELLPDLEWGDAPVGLRMEFGPKNPSELLASYREAKDRAEKCAAGKSDTAPPFQPWPKTLYDYLMKRLTEEYRVFYYALDGKRVDKDYKDLPGYTPQVLGDATESGAKIVRSLLRVDFLHAQRHLSDSDSRGRAEDLSRRLNRFYRRNLKQHEEDITALAALANSEEQLNNHLAAVFDPTLKRLNDLGYPGFAEPDLVIKSEMDAETILAGNASVFYALRDPGEPPKNKYLTLPDRYNGLGFKNLIYMVIEVLDFHHRWIEDKEDRPPIHLVMIEEPEAHLHAQLQQVFIRKLTEVLQENDPLFTRQFIITTHSPHIIYESTFSPIRYFRRSPNEHRSEVLNLSQFSSSQQYTKDFLLRYMKLTHCDLFFADAAILVEGNVERLLLPIMIEKAAKDLKSRYLSILEIGGAFAHVFRDLVHFLGLTTLVITDLDSVAPAPPAAKAGVDAGSADSSSDGGEGPAEAVEGSMCLVSTPGAVTSNQTLRTWIPKLTTISELLGATPEMKTPEPTATEPAKVRVAYQTQRSVTWNGETKTLAGRTLEEAFAYENLAWCQDPAQNALQLCRVKKRESPTLDEVVNRIHKRIGGGSFDKTEFALALMMTDSSKWQVPHYIAEGLAWLDMQMTVSAAATKVEASS